MAHEMIRLQKGTPIADHGAVVMGGHQDGVIAFGRSLAEVAGEVVVLMPPRG
jgi:hypothetical protein